MTILVSLAAALVAASVALPASAAGLDAYLWKARPVVVFAPDGASGGNAQLERLRAARATLQDRDMPVLVVRERTVTSLGGGSAPGSISAAGLRKAYGVGDREFAIVLVGKDGGEKLRATEPIAAERLTELVDGMPMRRREAR